MLRPTVTMAGSSSRVVRQVRTFATPSSLPIKDCTSITPPYPRLLQTLDQVRRVLPKGSKLTLAEKILYSHLRNPEESLGGGGKIRGERYLKLRPDRVAMQVSRNAQAIIDMHTRLICRMLRLRWHCFSS
jgi:homoaconitase